MAFLSIASASERRFNDLKKKGKNVMSSYGMVCKYGAVQNFKSHIIALPIRQTDGRIDKWVGRRA